MPAPRADVGVGRRRNTAPWGFGRAARPAQPRTAPHSPAQPRTAPCPAGHRALACRCVNTVTTKPGIRGPPLTRMASAPRPSTAASPGAGSRGIRPHGPRRPTGFPQARSPTATLAEAQRERPASPGPTWGAHRPASPRAAAQPAPSAHGRPEARAAYTAAGHRECRRACLKN